MAKKKAVRQVKRSVTRKKGTEPAKPAKPATPASPAGSGASGSGAAGPVGLGPGVTLPQGITIQRPTPSFSPDLQQALESARKASGYYVTITECDQEGNLSTKSFRGAGFNPDWLIRALRLAQAHILDGALDPVKPEGGA